MLAQVFPYVAKWCELFLGRPWGWRRLIDSSSGVGWPQSGSTMVGGAPGGGGRPSIFIHKSM